INLIVTVVFGLIYFYVTIPAINPQSGDFYVFIGALCVVYVLCALITSGFHMAGTPPKEYFRFVKNQCLPVGILFGLLIVVGIVGTVISMPIFRASEYRDLITMEDGDFATDIAQISFDE